MNLNSLYVLTIRYFFIMLTLILLSGLLMFIEHTSLSIEGVINYYEPKSIFGLLETVSPHLFGMGVALFILTHFYAVVDGAVSIRVYWLSFGLFLVMLFSNISGFFIGESSLIVAIIKLLSTLLFLVFSFIVMIHVSLKIKA